MEEMLDRDDATLADLQRFHGWLRGRKDFDRDLFRNVAYLSSEVGELVHALREMRRTADHDGERRAARAHVGEELADCLAYLLDMGNLVGIDLATAYRDKMRVNLGRDWPPPAPDGRGDHALA
jgi:NTP pyrophosphatase (non-canonical NTP hydrolase)